MFNSLRGQPLYNPLLITVVELLLEFDITLHVFHILLFLIQRSNLEPKCGKNTFLCPTDLA